MTLFKLIEARLSAGMLEGNMHICLRDEGRLAGGYLASGALTQSDIDDLESIASGLALNRCEAQSKWCNAVEYGRQQPLAGNESEYPIPIVQGHPLEWDDEIGGDKLKIVDPRRIEDDEVSEPSDEGWDQVVDLTTYLSTLFNSEDQVGYVTESWYDQGSGRHLPQKGVSDRTSGKLIALLNNCKGDIGSVMGDVNPDVGAWIRFNPLNGKGIKDENVTHYRYALVESDEVPVPKQYALLKEQRLPIATLVHSGGKSLHAVVRIDAKDRKEYDQRVKFLYEFCDKNGLTVDTANKNPSRLSRMPGVVRNGNKQFLIDTNIGRKNWADWKQWSDEDKQREEGHKEEEFLDQMEAERFDPTVVPPEDVTVYSLNGIPVCTQGNLGTISAAIKSGKSSFCGGLLAAPMADQESDCDCLGVESQNPDGKAVLYIDTEQSRTDFWHLVNRARIRANVETVPDWLCAYSMAGRMASDCRRAVSALMKRLSERHNGIHSVIIDGVADLVSSVNNEAECNSLVAELHGLALNYECPIIGIIHTNPISSRMQVDKTRGHLGSQLERKSETNLRLEKIGETTVVWSDKQRKAPILKQDGPTFKWSDHLKMHVSCDPSEKEPSASVKDLWYLAEEVFHDKPSLSFTELREAIERARDVAKSTAKRRITIMLGFKIITQSAGRYIYKKTQTKEVENVN